MLMLNTRLYSRRVICLLWLLGCVLSIMFIRLAWTDGDEGRYLLLAQAIEAGHGQVDIYLPEPQHEWLTPSGYLYYLAAWIKLCPTIFFLRISSLIPMVLFIGGFGFLLYKQTELSPLSKLGAFILGALPVSILYYSWMLFSEALFLLLVYISLFIVIRSKQCFWGFLVGILVGASMLVRPLGLALISAIFLHFLLQRRWKTLFIFCLGVLFIYLPELLRVYHLTGFPLAHLVHYNATATNSGLGLSRTLTEAVRESGPTYFFYYLPRSMFFSLFDHRSLLEKIHLGSLSFPSTLIICVLIMVGFLRRLKRISAMELFWFIYWSMICSYNQPDYASMGVFLYQPRYLVPILPLASMYLFYGGEFLLTKAIKWIRVKQVIAVFFVFIVVIYILLTSFGAGLVRVRKEWKMRGKEAWNPIRVAATGYPMDLAFSRYIETGKWIENNLQDNAIIASRKPRHTYLFSHRKGFRYDNDWINNRQGVWDNILAYQQYGPVYILQDAFPEDTGYGRTRIQVLNPVITAHTNDLTLVYETLPPVTRLWQVKEK